MLQARYENAYVHVMNVLRYLIDPSAGNAGTLPRESSLSDAERKEFLQTLLQVPRSSALIANFLSCSRSNILKSRFLFTQSLWISGWY